MDYSNVTGPTYASADKTAIACKVQFEGLDSPVPFIAHADDPEAHGQQLYVELTALKYGQIAAYVAPEPTPAKRYAEAIAKGVALTSGTDTGLNATYGVADADTADILSEATFISIYQEFTNSAQTLSWPDAEGKERVFPSPAMFLQFAKAVAVYVSACKQAFMSGTDYPSNTVLIG